MSLDEEFSDEVKARFGVIPDQPVGEYTKAFREWLDKRIAAGVKEASCSQESDAGI